MRGSGTQHGLLDPFGAHWRCPIGKEEQRRDVLDPGIEVLASDTDGEGVGDAMVELCCQRSS